MESDLSQNQTSPQQATKVTQPTPPPSRPKFLIPLFIGISLILGLGGGYVLFADKKDEGKQQPTQEKAQTSQSVIKETPSATPTPNEEEVWKTYTNEQLGISFIYPDSYVLKKDTSTEAVFTSLIGPEHLQTEVEKLRVTSKVTNPESVTFEKKDDSKKAMFAGKSVITFNGCCGDPGVEYIQTTEEPKLEIQFITHGGGGAGIREKIESSFKFIK